MAERRVTVDCRTHPGSGCSLLLEGTEKEVLEVAVPHAISRHGMADNEQTRQEIRSMMKEAQAAHR